MNKNLLWMAICISLPVMADGVDVYGAQSTQAHHLLKKHGTAVFQLEQGFLLKRFKSAVSAEDTARYLQQRSILQHQIATENHVAEVLFDTVYYPENKNIYTTIELAEHPILDAKWQDYKPKTGDLLDKMHLFIEKVAALIVSHPEFAKEPNCKDWHCISPEHPLVMTELKYFRQEVPKQKSLIIKSIQTDSYLARRRAAIFLLAFFHNPQEIADILNTALKDDSSFIRHDALRVYGELLKKAPNIKTKLSYFLPSLYSIHDAERNKTLIVLHQLVQQKSYRAQVDKSLLMQLKLLQELKQPNNHDLAQAILHDLAKT